MKRFLNNSALYALIVVINCALVALTKTADLKYVHGGTMGFAGLFLNLTAKYIIWGAPVAFFIAFNLKKLMGMLRTSWKMNIVIGAVSYPVMMCFLLQGFQSVYRFGESITRTHASPPPVAFLFMALVLMYILGGSLAITAIVFPLPATSITIFAALGAINSILLLKFFPGAYGTSTAPPVEHLHPVSFPGPPGYSILDEEKNEVV